MTEKNLNNLLVKILIDLKEEKREILDSLKNTSEILKRDDLIWHLLLCSMSTMWNSRWYKNLIENKENYNQVNYMALKGVNSEKRYAVLENTLKLAKVRMPLQKAKWLNNNYENIEKWGGALEVKKIAFSISWTEGKIKFLEQFEGIWAKYARNIWMDIYHPDFYQNIAIDERVKKITEALGLSFKNYNEHEAFYLDLAKKADIQWWELDRLLYQFNDIVLEKLRS